MIPVAPEVPQPLGHHLSALRRLLLRMLAAVGSATAVAFIAAPSVFRILCKPYVALLSRHDVPQTTFLLTLDPSETFKISCTIALMLGVFLVLPYLLYEIWRFVRPGLTRGERRWIFPLLAGGTLLFFCGAIFAYYAALPMMLLFFWDYSLRLGVTPSWSIAHYTNFVLGNLAAFGLAFELPIVTTLLVALGILTADQLRQYRRHSIFIICVVAAVLTPADVLSMILMAIPLLALYELSVILARIVGPRPRH